MNSDFKELLQLFADAEVKYLIVGGYAFMHHAEPRFTKDLDVWVRPDPENAEKVFRCLAKFGAPLKDERGASLTPKDFTDPGYFYAMGRSPVRVDVLMSVEGGSFDKSWENRVEAKFEKTPLLFVSHEDLIDLKRAAGRPQDLIDVEALRAAQQYRSNPLSERKVEAEQEKKPSEPASEKAHHGIPEIYEREGKQSIAVMRDIPSGADLQKIREDVVPDVYDQLKYPDRGLLYVEQVQGKSRLALTEYQLDKGDENTLSEIPKGHQTQAQFNALLASYQRDRNRDRDYEPER